MAGASGLLLAGALIGTLGALDDVAISQSSAVFELSKANLGLGWRAPFRLGMVIGGGHIAAMANTLLLAYVGAALPLSLLFSVYAEPLGTTLNREIIAEEIVRTLVGISIPDITANIGRADRITVTATDLDGRPVAFDCAGLLSRAAQQEIDHLNGILFIDRMDTATKAGLAGQQTDATGNGVAAQARRQIHSLDDARVNLARLQFLHHHRIQYRHEILSPHR